MQSIVCKRKNIEDSTEHGMVSIWQRVYYTHHRVRSLWKFIAQIFGISMHLWFICALTRISFSYPNLLLIIFMIMLCFCSSWQWCKRECTACNKRVFVCTQVGVHNFTRRTSTHDLSLRFAIKACYVTARRKRNGVEHH